MSASQLTQLKQKTEKLKEAENLIKKEIQSEKAELDILRASVAQADIELSLINDAFQLKFGEISDFDRKNALEAMDQLQEIERLEAILSLEQEKTQQLQSEVNRLEAIIPDEPNEDINLEDLKKRHSDLQEQYKSLQIRNKKREKNIRLTESKIAQAQVEMNEIQEKLQERASQEAEIEKKREKAEEILNKIKELSEQYKEHNASLHALQKEIVEANNKIEEIEDNVEKDTPIYEENIKETEELESALATLEASNAPMRELKMLHELFEKDANEILIQMNEKLVEITSLIDVIRAEMEEKPLTQ